MHNVGILTGNFVEKVFFYVFMLQHVSGSGRLQVTLHSYVFEYEPKTTEVNNVDFTAQPTNVTFTPGKVYTPQWQHMSGPPDRQNMIRMTSDWPWTSKTQCSASTQYRFLICLDYVDKYDPENPCSLERIQTGQIRIDRSPFSPSALGRETISFSTFLGIGDDRVFLLNPLSVDFPTWQGPVRLSVYVNCCGEQDIYKGQCMETLATTINFTPNIFVEGTQTRLYTLRGRGSFQLSASATCDPTYYGPSCDIHCLVENPSFEHTFCNTTTGMKQCLKGWSGQDCQTDIDECQSISCQNKGTCKNLPGTFVCQCLQGTRGTFCEKRFPICYTKPCQNQGTCLDTPSSGSLCMCPPGFEGHWCEEVEKQTTTLAAVTFKLHELNLTIAQGLGVDAIAQTVDMKQESNVWKGWYLAIILGPLACVIIVISILLYRHKVNRQYKVSVSDSSVPNISNQASQFKSRQFNNEVYHTSDPSNIIQSNIIHNFHTHTQDNSHIGDYCNFPQRRSVDSFDSSVSGLEGDVTEALQEKYSPAFMDNPAFENGKLKNVNVEKEKLKMEQENCNEKANDPPKVKIPMLPPKFSKNILLTDDEAMPMKATSHFSQADPIYVTPSSENALKVENFMSPANTVPDKNVENTYEVVNSEHVKKAFKPKPLPRSIYKIHKDSHQGNERNVNAENASHHVPLDDDGYCVPVTSNSQEDCETPSGDDIYMESSPGIEGAWPSNVQQNVPSPTSKFQDFNTQESVYSSPPNNSLSFRLHSTSSLEDESSVYANMPNVGSPLGNRNDNSDVAYLEPRLAFDVSQHSIYANMSAINPQKETDTGEYVNFSECKALQD
ncbi:fibropellin-1 [Biomphalaria glabrata]|nr:fibropellin-1 [Biomphalaria glabrata]